MKIRKKGDGLPMAESPGTLRLRVLLCFLQKDKVCSVMGISRTLKEPKQTISRTLIALEKDGLIDRSNLRNPILTEKGQVRASYYAERMEVMLNHLLYEGVDINSARQDALQWALYSSDKAMETIRATEERYRVKYELRNQKRFSGRQLCRLLKDGVYQFPFLIYREHVKNGTNISMANEGFEHPCTLYVDGGEGLIQLRALSISAKSGSDGNVMSGRAQSMQYFDSGRFIDSEINGNVFSFPADVLNFVNMGNGVGQILHGSCPVKIECSVGLIHMPESTAIFTILI